MDDLDKAAALEALLLDLGAEYVPSRRNAAMRCVFHDDATASAVVDLDNGLFWCHVCALGGDAITLVEKTERVEFRDAVQKLQGLVAASGGQVRGSPPEQQSGYLPRRARNTPRRSRWVPLWKRDGTAL